MKISIILLTILSTGCASTNKLPMPSSTPIKINNTTESLALLDQSGVVLIGPRKDEAHVKQFFMRQPMRLLTRQPNPEDFERIGAALVERTVTVTFPDSSTELNLTGSQRFHIRQLAALASRVEIRGRTSNEVSTPESIWFATERAEAAKRHLLDLQMPGRDMSINVMGAGDYIADNQTSAGRAQNQRVEIEFFVEGEPVMPLEAQAELLGTAKTVEVVDCDSDQWQEVGSTQAQGNCVNLGVMQ